MKTPIVADQNASLDAICCAYRAATCPRVVIVFGWTSTVVQTLDYFPFGGLRIDTGTNVSERKYIGERYDQTTGLNYLNARYYASDRGQFISQDPVFWEIGLTQDG